MKIVLIDPELKNNNIQQNSTTNNKNCQLSTVVVMGNYIRLFSIKDK
ncbi:MULTISPECIES: hypothetical protein [Petrotoga]|nr:MULTISPECIES: hypothetical protein [Petrotoga]